MISSSLPTEDTGLVAIMSPTAEFCEFCVRGQMPSFMSISSKSLWEIGKTVKGSLSWKQKRGSKRKRMVAGEGGGNEGRK